MKDFKPLSHRRKGKGNGKGSKKSPGKKGKGGKGKGKGKGKVNRTCRFWELGKCARANNCRFLHGHESPSRQEQSVKDKLRHQANVLKKEHAKAFATLMIKQGKSSDEESDDEASLLDKTLKKVMKCLPTYVITNRHDDVVEYDALRVSQAINHLNQIKAIHSKGYPICERRTGATSHDFTEMLVIKFTHEDDQNAIIIMSTKSTRKAAIARCREFFWDYLCIILGLAEEKYEGEVIQDDPTTQEMLLAYGQMKQGVENHEASGLRGVANTHAIHSNPLNHILIKHLLQTYSQDDSKHSVDSRIRKLIRIVYQEVSRQTGFNATAARLQQQAKQLKDEKYMSNLIKQVGDNLKSNSTHGCGAGAPSVASITRLEKMRVYPFGGSNQQVHVKANPPTYSPSSGRSPDKYQELTLAAIKIQSHARKMIKVRRLQKLSPAAKKEIIKMNEATGIYLIKKRMTEEIQFKLHLGSLQGIHALASLEDVKLCKFIEENVIKIQKKIKDCLTNGFYFAEPQSLQMEIMLRLAINAAEANYKWTWEMHEVKSQGTNTVDTAIEQIKQENEFYQAQIDLRNMANQIALRYPEYKDWRFLSFDEIMSKLNTAFSGDHEIIMLDESTRKEGAEYDIQGLTDEEYAQMSIDLQFKQCNFKDEDEKDIEVVKQRIMHMFRLIKNCKDTQARLKASNSQAEQDNDKQPTFSTLTKQIDMAQDEAAKLGVLTTLLSRRETLTSHMTRYRNEHGKTEPRQVQRQNDSGKEETKEVKIKQSKHKGAGAGAPRLHELNRNDQEEKSEEDCKGKKIIANPIFFSGITQVAKQALAGADTCCACTCSNEGSDFATVNTSKTVTRGVSMVGIGDQEIQVHGKGEAVFKVPKVLREDGTIITDAILINPNSYKMIKSTKSDTTYRLLSMMALKDMGMPLKMDYDGDSLDWVIDNRTKARLPLTEHRGILCMATEPVNAKKYVSSTDKMKVFKEYVSKIISGEKSPICRVQHSPFYQIISIDEDFM